MINVEHFQVFCSVHLRAKFYFGLKTISWTFWHQAAVSRLLIIVNLYTHTRTHSLYIRIWFNLLLLNCSIDCYRFQASELKVLEVCTVQESESALLFVHSMEFLLWKAKIDTYSTELTCVYRPSCHLDLLTWRFSTMRISVWLQLNFYYQLRSHFCPLYSEQYTQHVWDYSSSYSLRNISSLVLRFFVI